MLFLPVPGRVVDLSSFVCNLLFIAHPGVDYIDGAHWYVAALVELQLFIAIFYSIKNTKVRIYSLLGFLAVLVVLIQVLLRLGWECPLELYRFLNGSEGILIGICIGLIKEYKVCIPIFGVLVVWLTHLSWLYPFYIGLLFLCYIYQGNMKFGKIVGIVLGNRFLTWVGGMSYAWYLIHQNVGYSLIYHILPNGTTNKLWLALPILLTMLLAIVINAVEHIINKNVVSVNNRLNK